MDDNVARAIGRVFREGPRVVQLIIASNMVCLYALDDPSAYGTSRWKHDWRRTLTSAFAHADESHLLGNMSVLAGTT
jgi:membrane associated rhomboid family serine protease